MPDDYRTTEQRIAHIQDMIATMRERYEKSDMVKESYEICIAALKKRVKDLQEGEDAAK